MLWRSDVEEKEHVETYHGKHLINFVCGNAKVLEVDPSVSVESIVQFLSDGTFLNFGACEEFLE